MRISPVPSKTRFYVHLAENRLSHVRATTIPRPLFANVLVLPDFVLVLNLRFLGPLPNMNTDVFSETEQKGFSYADHQEKTSLRFL